MSEDQPLPEPTQPYTVQSWTHSVIRPTLIILMVTAMMGAIFSVAMMADPHRVWTFGFLICFIVILESYFTTSWLDHPDRRNLNHATYRAAEVIVIILTIRLLTWAIQGNWPEINNWLSYLSNPFDLFSDGYFWSTLILCLIAWQRTIAISQSFHRMKPDEAEVAYYTLPRQERNPGNQPISDDRSHLLSGFSQQFLGGGIVVLLCAALASFNLTGILDADNPLTSGLSRLGLNANMLASLIIYFLCGFLLLSQGQAGSFRDALVSWGYSPTKPYWSPLAPASLIFVISHCFYCRFFTSRLHPAFYAPFKYDFIRHGHSNDNISPLLCSALVLFPFIPLPEPNYI